MDVANMILEYLKVFLSTQMVFGAVGITAIIIFKTEVKSLFNRLAFFKWGAAELSAPQPTSSLSIDTRAAIDKQPDANPVELPADIEESTEDAKKLKQAMLAERERAQLWEYRYLNYFLVASTQHVLDWLCSLPNQTTFTTYDAMWQVTIPTAEGRKNVIRALEEHNLIVLQGDLIEVTPKGREYIQWRGPMPPAQFIPAGLNPSMAWPPPFGNRI